MGHILKIALNIPKFGILDPLTKVTGDTLVKVCHILWIHSDTYRLNRHMCLLAETFRHSRHIQTQQEN